MGKDASPEDLAAAIRAVHGGRIYLEDALKDLLVAEKRSAPSKLDLLSDREFEVLKRFAAERSVSEVAAELSLSAKTVSTYRTRLLEKLALKTTLNLVRYGVARKLDEPGDA
jgi:DNA-binding NarL/FixJ family response regulator